MTQDLPTNTSLSLLSPALQLAWDSTSTGALKTCPKLYQYSILEGYQPRILSVHLTFGLLYHAALERYDHAKAQGLCHEEAQLLAVRYALEATWDRQRNRPWVSDDSNKNRLTLVRTVSWYLEQFADDPLKTVILDSGKPAVELSFRMDLGLCSSAGEAFWLCGHLDRVATMQDTTYIVDRKTSKHQLGDDYFAQYSPHNQFSTYIFGGKIVYALPVRALIVDAAQVAVTFSRFQRGIVQRHEASLDEWFQGLAELLQRAEYYAKTQFWPMNETACGNYGGCPFRVICAKPPSMRGEWLARLFTRRVWDPLVARGDI